METLSGIESSTTRSILFSNASLSARCRYLFCESFLFVLAACLRSLYSVHLRWNVTLDSDDKSKLKASLRAVYISLVKSKIHRAVVTEQNINYEGSLAISADLAELAQLEEFERILVGNMANGERFETYVIYPGRGSGTILLNGICVFWCSPMRRFKDSVTRLVVDIPARCDSDSTHLGCESIIGEFHDVSLMHEGHRFSFD